VHPTPAYSPGHRFYPGGEVWMRPKQSGDSTPVKRARVSKKATPKKSASAYNRDYQKMIGSSLEKLLLILVLPTAPSWTRFFELAREQNF
jgi:hypothetical protein